MTQYEAYLPGYIDSKIAALVGGAPSSLDTLAKLAQSIGNNSNLSSNLLQQIATKQDIINDNSLPVSKIAGLTVELQSKYSRAEVDALLAQKQSILTAASSVPVSGITNFQDELDKKAALISPAFLGSPTAPTPGISTNNTQVATTGFVVDKIDELIDGVLEDMQTELNQKATTNQLNTGLATKDDKT